MMPLALNIPTFINLYGYGYKNIYELKVIVPIIENFTCKIKENTLDKNENNID
jgi:hypothetical protein